MPNIPLEDEVDKDFKYQEEMLNKIIDMCEFYNLPVYDVYKVFGQAMSDYEILMGDQTNYCLKQRKDQIETAYRQAQQFMVATINLKVGKEYKGKITGD